MATTVSGNFTANGVSSTLSLGNQVENVTYSFTGPLHGKVSIERAITPDAKAWEPVAGPFSSPTVTKAGTFPSRPNDRYRVRAQDLPTNLVTNGTFAADSNWTKGDGWTIAAGVASSDGSQSAASLLSQTLADGLVAGASYVVTYTITRSAGSIKPVLGGTDGTTRSSANTFSETIVAGATDVFSFSADADFVGTVDNVTITPTIAYSLSDEDAIVHETRNRENVPQLTRKQDTFVVAGALAVGGAVTAGGALLAADGAFNAAGIGFASQPGLGFHRASSNRMQWTNDGGFGFELIGDAGAVAFQALNGSGPRVEYASVTATANGFVPNRGDGNTSWTWAAADTLSANAGGVSSMQFHTAGFSIPDGVAAPSAVTGRAIIYVDTADGDLKVKFADGHVAVIAADS